MSLSRGHVSFPGCTSYMLPVVRERNSKYIISLPWPSDFSGFHGKMYPRYTCAFAEGKWVVWISRNTPVTTQVLPQITKEHQVMYCFQTLRQHIYFVCTWHLWCKQSDVFFSAQEVRTYFFQVTVAGREPNWHNFLSFNYLRGCVFFQITCDYVLFRIIFWWVTDIETTHLVCIAYTFKTSETVVFFWIQPGKASVLQFWNHLGDPPKLPTIMWFCWSG